MQTKGFSFKKMVPVFGTDLVPETGGQRSVTQPFVSFRCPPNFGTVLVPKIGTHFFGKGAVFTFFCVWKIMLCQPSAADAGS